MSEGGRLDAVYPSQMSRLSLPLAPVEPPEPEPHAAKPEGGQPKTIRLAISRTGHRGGNALVCALWMQNEHHRTDGTPLPSAASAPLRCPPMLRAERLSALLETLASQRSIDVGAMAAEFGVSSATVRRDLHTLHEQGLLVRTHGGAVSSDMDLELPVRYRTSLRRPEKLRIAQAAASLVPNNAVVGLTGGTTTTELGSGSVRSKRGHDRHQCLKHRF